MDLAIDYEPRARRISLPSRGGEMAVLDFGPRERPVDVVFSHATGFNARSYRTILAPLAAELRILALDLTGHGLSDLPTDPESWPGWSGFAADVLALLDAETDGPVVLAGHSMGATASLLAAAEAPQRVRALTLFEPVLMDKAPSRDYMWKAPFVQAVRRRRDTFQDLAEAEAAYRGRGVFATWSEAQIADYVSGGFREAPGGGVVLTCLPEWEAVTFSVHGYDAWKAFGRLQCPVTIIAAGEGSCVGPYAREFAERHGFRFEHYPQATHMLPMEYPDVVRDALRQASIRS
jgi:pimeloyl-ACP methyl ester carboxylesterase